MNQLKWDRNQIIKIYKKQLKKIQNNNSISMTNTLDSFITSLRFIRDLYLIDLSVDLKTNINFSTLQTALTEYALYENCILKYYKVIKNPTQPLTVEPINKEKSKEEVLTEYQNERVSHWATFWTLVSTYIEDWGSDEFTF